MKVKNDTTDLNHPTCDVNLCIFVFIPLLIFLFSMFFRFYFNSTYHSSTLVFWEYLIFLWHWFSMCSLTHRIQSECGKIRPRKTSNTDTFYAVMVIYLCTENKNYVKAPWAYRIFLSYFWKVFDKKRDSFIGKPSRAIPANTVFALWILPF